MNRFRDAAQADRGGKGAARALAAPAFAAVARRDRADVAAGHGRACGGARQPARARRQSGGTLIAIPSPRTPPEALDAGPRDRAARC